MAICSLIVGWLLSTRRFLVEESVLAACNKWRRARGDIELTPQDVHPDNQPDTSNGGGNQ